MNEKTPQCNMHEALVSVLYDETTPEEITQVRTHLAECGSCRRELSEFEQVRGMLRQWQVDDVPVLRIAPQQPRRSALEVLKELLGVMPIWVKSLGAVAAAMLVLAVLGSEISIGRSGFTLKADLFRSVGPEQQTTGGARLSQSQVEAMVKEMIGASAERQRSELQAELVRIESALQSANASDLARLAASIKQYRTRLDTLERDIDRREGLDLADILVGGSAPERSGSSDGAGGGQ